jgi:redox-sensitive bicupin YhaK (pirin superfamily)
MVHVSKLEEGEIKYNFANGRLGYLFVIDGEITVNGSKCQTKDSVMIENEQSIVILPNKSSEIILLDLDGNS